LSEALRDMGAVVTGFDAAVHVADLARRLPFADEEFDDVVASLVLHYLEDWAGPLAELRPVLKPGGRLILSVIHSSVYAVVYPEADYFALTRYSEEYTLDGQSAVLTFGTDPSRHDSCLGLGRRAYDSRRVESSERREPSPEPGGVPGLHGHSPDSAWFRCGHGRTGDLAGRGRRRRAPDRPALPQRAAGARTAADERVWRMT
jgi:SAM-dependent methyltransferase